MAWLRRWAIKYRATFDEHMSILSFTVWAACTPVTLLFTHYLLNDLNWHYPIHLLLLQLLTAATVSSIRSIRRKEGEKETQSSRAAILRDVLAGVSMAFASQALLHSANSASFAMLPLFVFVGQAYLAALTTPFYKGCKDLLRLLGLGIAVVAVVGDEYRLTGNGIAFAAVAVLCAIATRRIGENIPHPDKPDRCFYLSAISVTMVLCVAFGEKTSTAFQELRTSMVPALFVNLLASCVNILYGRTWFITLLPPKVRPQKCSEERPGFAGSLEVTGMVYIFVATGAWTLQYSYVSPIQLAGFTLGVIALDGGKLLRLGSKDEERLPTISDEKLAVPFAIEVAKLESEYELVEHQMVMGLLNPGPELRVRMDSLKSKLMRLRLRLPSKEDEICEFESSGLAQILYRGAFFYMVVLFLLQNYLFRPLSVEISPNTSLDRSYTPIRQTEIVISAYKEPLADINNLVTSLKSIPSLADANVHVYTKDPFANVTDILLGSGADIVTHLPNIGREGHTYLDHIVNYWDDLAAHTLFVQGDVHNPREFYPRVRDYYDPQRTGFLSLGFVGHVCDCNTCSDQFGWSDPTIIQTYHHKIYPQDTCNNVLLTYKGQFIASGQRIRGVDKSLWEELKTSMEEQTSWMHRAEYRNGRYDSLNQPQFGYSLERMWGMLMQCNDMEIAWKCPTLLSGRRTGGDQGDCQCFDNVINDSLKARITAR